MNQQYPQMYYGQDENAVVQQIRQEMPGFSNVRQDFLLYDTIRIGSAVPTNINGWYTNFTNMLAAGGVHSFFDQRQEAETGTTYTNMKKKTGLDWPVIITSFGVDFIYTDPVNSDLYDGDRASAKLWADHIKRHTDGALYTGGADDKILTFLPEHTPYGFGTWGNQVGGDTVGFSSLLANGEPLAGNQFQFKSWALALPKDFSIAVRLNFAKAARDMMALMADVKGIEFANGTYANEAMIRICMRGMRDVQQVGNYIR